MSKLNSRQRALVKRILATKQQIAGIERKQARYGCFSERTMFYGVRNLNSHIATLYWDMAEV